MSDIPESWKAITRLTTKGFPDRIVKIMLDLAEKGPASGYSLAKRTGIPTSSTYGGLKLLHESGYVEMRVDPEWTGFLDKKEYRLTILGLSGVAMEADLDTLPLFLAAWPELIPLVAGKWKRFLEAEVADLAISKFKAAANSFISSRIEELIFGIAADAGRDAEQFTQYFYHPLLGLKDSEERLRWAVACAKDSELRDYFLKRCEEMVKRNKALKLEAEAMLQVLSPSDSSGR